MMEFRELTLQRLQKFLDQRFFTIRDYLNSAQGRAILQTWLVRWRVLCAAAFAPAQKTPMQQATHAHAHAAAQTVGQANRTR